MRLVPRPPQIGPNDGFTSENDIFGYREFGERLGNLVAGIDQPLTLLLDGPWGSGKSTFVKQWAGHLRNRGAAVVEFDAFANDHQDDAFIVLAAEIIALAKEHLGGNESRVRKLVHSAKKAGTRLLPLATRFAIRASTMGILSVDDFEAAGDTVKEFAKDLGDEAAKAAEQAVSDRIRNARNDHAAMATFRQSLKDVSDAIRAKATDSQQPNFPLVFIIDELDRCRPPFALALLERIKHLFAVDGVAFLLVTNLEQMSAAVKGSYGQDTNASIYLDKFYDLRLTLQSGLKQEPETERYIKFIWKEMDFPSPDKTEPGPFLQEFSLLANATKLSLRSIDRVATHIALALSAADKSLKLAPIIVGLAFIRHAYPELYLRARSGQITWPEIQDALLINEWPEYDREWSSGWWRYMTDPGMSDDEIEKYRTSLHRYAIRNRNDAFKWFCNLIEQTHLIKT